MKPAVLTLLGLLLSAAAPGAAHADWAFTRWAMTPQQVIDASTGAVQEARGDKVNGFELGAAGDIEEDGLRFRGEFYFHGVTRRLHVIRLVLKDTDRCADLVESLTRRFGEPVDMSTTFNLRDGPVRLTALKWPTQSPGNYVAFTHLPQVGGLAETCFARYRPADEPDAPNNVDGAT